MRPAGDPQAKFAVLTVGGLIISSSRRIDIRQLDFVALKAAGYRGAVVDKDNCLVRLFYILHPEWASDIFLGFGNVSRPCPITTNSFRN